jgi:hypothetical protein
MATPPTRTEHVIEIQPLDDMFTFETEFLSEVDEVRPHDSVAPLSEDVEPTPLPADVVRRDPAPPRPDETIFATSEPPRLETLSIADLLHNSPPIEWPEAVAIAEQICESIARHSSDGAQEYLLDPRQIAISERGEVHVVVGAPGSDPMVKQVGRILRALLEGGSAPASLRLLASQAATELPGFATVHELADALRGFRKSPQSEAIQTAFRRSRDTRFSAPPAPVAPVAPPIPVFSRPVPLAPVFVQGPRFAVRYRLTAVVLVLVSLAAGLAFVVFRGLTPTKSPSDRSVAPAFVEAPIRAAADTTPHEVTATGPAQEVPTPAPIIPPPDRVATRAPGRNVPLLEVKAPTVSSDGQQRAAPQPVFGADDAQRLFDRIVLSDPFYKLSPERATPEAVAALRDSKRVLVPEIARRDHERARTFFETGAYDRAATEATRVSRMLDDLEPGSAPPGLIESNRQLLARIESARAREDQRIYTEADAAVMPPEALSRQFPATPPFGMSKGQIGTLEIVISRSGQVEAIRLHTPLNRYHERMIVSAAKAWRYRPALKDGKPVRYRLFSSINLPES